MSKLPNAISNYGLDISDVGFRILADENYLQTPLHKDLILPTAALAEKIIEECRAQKEKIIFKKMPLTQLASAAIDMTEEEQSLSIDHLLNYIGSELLCHRAAEPSALRSRQEELWQPTLDWCAAHFGVSLKATDGVMPISQSAATFDRLRKAIEAYDPFQRVGLVLASDICGSLILGLALKEARLSSLEVFEASELDASFQILVWQEDPEALKRRLIIKTDLLLCENWFKLLGQKA